MAITPIDTTLQMVAEVLEFYAKNEVGNAIATSNAFLSMLLKNTKGGLRRVPGGRQITERVILLEDANSQWYSGVEPLNTVQSDAIREAVFTWKQAAGSIVVSGIDMRNASADKFSKSNLINDIKTQVDTTVKQLVGQGIWNPAPAANEISSVPNFVDDTTVVGGLDPVTYPLWASSVTPSLTTVPALSGSELLDDMEALYNTIMSNSGKAPNCVVAGPTLYTKYGRACQELKRFSAETRYRADIGFSGYDFNQAFFCLDGYCPANELYMLNTEDFKLNVHKDAFFTFTPMRMREDEDAYYSRVLFQGELSIKNRKTQGKIVYTV